MDGILCSPIHQNGFVGVKIQNKQFNVYRYCAATNKYFALPGRKLTTNNLMFVLILVNLIGMLRCPICQSKIVGPVNKQLGCYFGCGYFNYSTGDPQMNNFK